MILILLDDMHFHFMLTAMQEVRARGATCIAITDRAADCEGASVTLISRGVCLSLSLLLLYTHPQSLTHSLTHPLARSCVPRSGIAHHILPVPTCGDLTALLACLPLQLLAYELAIRRGVDPDKPRNLAKAVTVD